MSKKHLTLSDLKAQGLRLTKTEATELLPHITEISHRGLDDNYLFVEPEGIDDLDREDDDDDPNEKMIWEFNDGSNGWCVLAPENLDEEGNLKDAALDHFEFMKSQPDAERGDCSSYWFRQTPESQIGKGDSTGNVKVLIFLDIDDVDEKQINNSDSLSAEQEAELMAAIGITTENSPEEYLTALNGFIDGITVEVPPKLLKKQAELQQIVAASNTGTDNAGNTDGKKEHYLTKRKRLKDAGLMEYTITQEDVDSSKYAGKAGDVIEIPIVVE